MRRVKALKNTMTRLARQAAERAGEMTQRSAVQVAETLHDKGHQLKHGAQAKALADAVLRTGEQLIDKSPLPVPVVVRDALGRMQDALGQLGNAIEGLDAGVDAKAGAQAAALKAQQVGKHFSGKVPGSHAAEFAAAAAKGHDKQAHKGSHGQQTHHR